MADIGVKIEASGFETIEKEAKLILNAKVSREISNAVYADMKEALEQHVKDDIYRSYYPEKYLRRSENPSFGTSLLKSAETAKQIGPFALDVTRRTTMEQTGKNCRGGTEKAGNSRTRRPHYRRYKR